MTPHLLLIFYHQKPLLYYYSVTKYSRKSNETQVRHMKHKSRNIYHYQSQVVVLAKI